MVRFIIVRHGFSVYNREKRFNGQGDVPLDEVGVRQAQRNAAYVLAHYKIDAIWSSDLSRAYHTAKPIADALGLPIMTSVDLREVSVGVWEGLTVAEIRAREPEALAHYRSAFPDASGGGGETRAQLRARLIGVMDRIAAAHEGQTVLVATHGGAILALCCAWMGYPIERIAEVPDPGNASLTVVNYDTATGQATFELYGYTEHLGELAVEKR